LVSDKGRQKRSEPSNLGVEVEKLAKFKRGDETEHLEERESEGGKEDLEAGGKEVQWKSEIGQEFTHMQLVNFKS